MKAVRVLHVEDESDIRDVVELSLRLDPDFITRSCSTGQEAVVVASDWPADIILLDVMMPMMDGPATLAHLQDNKQTARIPVVFMTARAQARELEHFRSLGAAGVIPKPFDPMTLAATVRRYIQPVQDQLSKMRVDFLDRFDRDTEALKRCRSALTDLSTERANLEQIKRLAHGLAGAGGIFGFGDISEAAAALEEAVILLLKDPGSNENVVLALNRLVELHRKDGKNEKTAY